MKKWRRYNPLGNEEKDAVNRVLDSGCLSKFIGAWSEDFFGGEEVQAFEKEICQFFNSPHAVVFNSLTSGLVAAVGALGIKPGDEVIVSPWTMCATATAIVIWGGIPVFVDIEKNNFGINPKLLEAKISEKTRGIIVPNIFGHAAMLEEICAIAKRHELFVVEDNAQSPGIKNKGRYLGTWGHIGGFSLNYHKHIHTGEGGFCLCKDEELALKMRLIRNHAEAAVLESPIDSLHNMVGFNFRMGEIEAAIGRAQLKKLPKLLERNQDKAKIILKELSSEPWLGSTDAIEEHAYYVLPFKIIDHRITNKELVRRCKDNGVPGLLDGYVNVHLLPMYQQKIAFDQYPWSISEKTYEYHKGICPVAEELHDSQFFGLLISMYELDESDCIWIANTIKESARAILCER